MGPLNKFKAVGLAWIWKGTLENRKVSSRLQKSKCNCSTQKGKAKRFYEPQTVTLMSTIGYALINSLIHSFSNHLLSPNGPNLILDVGDTEINRKSSIILNSLLFGIDYIQIGS